MKKPKAIRIDVEASKGGAYYFIYSNKKIARTLVAIDNAECLITVDLDKNDDPVGVEVVSFVMPSWQATTVTGRFTAGGNFITLPRDRDRVPFKPSKEPVHLEVDFSSYGGIDARVAVDQLTPKRRIRGLAGLDKFEKASRKGNGRLVKRNDTDIHLLVDSLRASATGN